MKQTFVPPSGNPNAKIAIVGEQPGIQEIQRGKPFIGPASRGLDECLQMIKMQKQDLYFTYVIKDLDKPLKYYINLNVQNKYTISPEGYQYIQELGEELKKLNPNLIIAFGNIALIALCSRIGINKWRGSVIESTLIPGIKVIPTLSPETFVPPKFNFLNKPLICSDLELARHECEFREIRKLERKLIIKPTFEEAKSYLEYYYTMGLTGQIIGIDIEVINGELDCISFSSNRLRAISIPFKGPKGNYFSIEQEYQLMLLIAKIIQEPEIKKAGANFIFDTQFLLRKYNIIPKGTLHCTQIAQKISLPDYPAGLDFVTNTHTDLPYYKQDGKQWMNQGAGTWEEWWNYSAIDALVPVEAIPKQLKILKAQENERTYERQNKLIKPLIYMSERGIKLDVENMIFYKAEQQEKLDTLAEELNKEVGYEINYNSPKQLMEYFYGKLGIKPFKKRNAKGQYNNSIDVDALKRISKNHKIKSAQLMLDIRGLSKRISTYLNIEKIDSDGRYRSSYKPVGAETGRIASGETIFGTGGNQQNWPHDLLKFFLFDKGYIGYAFDLSQIENRIVAYVGRVIEQIKAFEQGIDLHTLTAAIIANKPYHEISDEDGSSPLGDGRQSERFWGKKGNHCLLSSAKVLTLDGWIPIEEAMNSKCKIAQWEKTGKINFVAPTNWFSDYYTGEILTILNQRIFQQATINHKMPLIYNNKLITKKISDYPNSGKYRAILSGKYCGKYLYPAWFIKLLVAFQADGYWHGNGIAFKLSKQRKIDRLKSILKDGNIEYNNNHSGIYIPANNTVSIDIKSLLGKEKLFDNWLLYLGSPNLKTFLNELPYWDGYIEKRKGTDKKQYFTTVIQNAEWVQTIAHLCNKATLINIQDNSNTNAFGNKKVYRLTIRDSIYPTTSAINKIFKNIVNEKIFCPTVPSGFFLVKEGGKISVTGNSTNYDVGYKTFALKNEMQEKDAKYILEKIHKGYPQIRGGYHLTIQNMLRENRTVTNLFGRTRLFLGPIIPSYPNTSKNACMNTYREAYAHLAQSTCADKINEQGVNFIYYNQNLFRPIELLTQIHDSVVFQIPLSIPFEEHAKMLLKIKDSLETPLYWKGLEIKTPVDLSIGFNMYKKDMKELKGKDIPNDVELFSNKLKEIYDGLCEPNNG